MLNDIRYALRTMRQNPGFALTAIFSIALGIGVNSTIFSFANGLLLRPLPVPNPSQVFSLTTLLAAAVPARRASRVDPMWALRQD